MPWGQTLLSLTLGPTMSHRALLKLVTKRCPLTKYYVSWFVDLLFIKHPLYLAMKSFWRYFQYSQLYLEIIWGLLLSSFHIWALSYSWVLQMFPLLMPLMVWAYMCFFILCAILLNRWWVEEIMVLSIRLERKLE